MKETGLTGKRRSTTIAATPDDGKSQRKRRRYFTVEMTVIYYVYSGPKTSLHWSIHGES